MAKRQFHLNESELQQLRRREQQADTPAELKRLQAVRLYGSGMAVALITDLVGCVESSVRLWVQLYHRDGLAGLTDHYDRSAGNAHKLSAEQRADLRQRLHATRPDQVLSATVRVSPGQFWTVSDLRLVVNRWYGVVYADPSSYRALLHQSGFSYQRAERVYKSRPNAVAVADFELALEKK